MAGHREPNLKSKTDPYYGRHLVVDRTLYTHHGIGVGNGMVIHYDGPASGLSASDAACGCLRIVSLDQFADGAEVQIRPHPNRKFTPEESVRRAHDRLPECEYSAAFNNCEHFVNWCIEGEEKSSQVRTVAALLATVAIVAGAIIALAGGQDNA